MTTPPNVNVRQRRSARRLAVGPAGEQVASLRTDKTNWRTCYKYFRQWSERPPDDTRPYVALEPVYDL